MVGKYVKGFFLQNLFSRLRAELAKLRRMYEEETEKAKKEFMYLHSTKVEQIKEAQLE